VAHSKKDKRTDEWKSSFFNLLVFEALPLPKGTRLEVTGYIEVDQYEKDGVRRDSVNIIATDVKVLDEYKPQGGQQPAKDYPNKAGFDDDIPF